MSRFGKPVRLTDERWAHITEEHNELAGLRLEVLKAVSQAERIVQGQYGALLAMRTLAPGSWLVVVYREMSEDGFVITAFLTHSGAFLARRTQLWP